MNVEIKDGFCVVSLDCDPLRYIKWHLLINDFTQLAETTLAIWDMESIVNFRGPIRR